jgi:uncharacterized peroxidase-related enzyme
MDSLFNFYSLTNASPEAKPLLEKINASYGFIPNLFAYMAEAPTTIEAYLALNELISKSSLTPQNAQLALWVTSIENQCEFCRIAHQAFAKKFGVKEQTYHAILTGQKIECPTDAALVNFTQAVVNKRGHLTHTDLESFLGAGFNQQQIMEIILVVTIKTLSNYINHLTHPEVNPEVLALLQ